MDINLEGFMCTYIVEEVLVRPRTHYPFTVRSGTMKTRTMMDYDIMRNIKNPQEFSGPSSVGGPSNNTLTSISTASHQHSCPVPPSSTSGHKHKAMMTPIKKTKQMPMFHTSQEQSLTLRGLPKIKDRNWLESASRSLE